MCFIPSLKWREVKAIELGSGTGLAGLHVGRLCKHLVLSDYNEWVVNNLKYNVELNKSLLQAETVEVMKLDWSEQIGVDLLHSFDMVLMCETLYEDAYMASLSKSVDSLVGPNGVCVAVTQLERAGVDSFKVEMQKLNWTFEQVTLPHPDDGTDSVGYILLIGTRVSVS